jgi:uncharacterized protein (DUF4415 family)
MSESRTEGHSLEEVRQMESRTDWERLRRMTEEDIEKVAREDPESPLLDEDWFRTARLVMPSGDKKRITIRLDEDIVDYFKRQGTGYQTRINDVLKAYVLSQQLKEHRDVLEKESPSG